QYWDYMLTGPYVYPGARQGDVRSLAVIGLGAGTVARQYTAIYGPIPIDGVEIDPRIVALGRADFAMTEPNLRVHVADGRWWLRQSRGRYDVVAIDAYHQPYIPFQLCT